MSSDIRHIVDDSCGTVQRKTRLCLSAMLLVFPRAGIACKFHDVGLVENAKRAEYVFIAGAETSSNDMSERGPETPARMRVIRTIKGTVGTGELVPIYTSSSSCGLGIQQGQQWLILASGKPMRADHPSGSVLLHDQSIRSLVFRTFGVTLN